MEKVVHARIDIETQRLLEQLRLQTGLNDSTLVRRGIRALASQTLLPAGRLPIGVGQFESGVSDLGSNKEPLSGFGS